MKNRQSYGSRMCASIVALALGGLVACESQEQVAQEQAGTAENSVTIALSTVPASTLCVRVTATPAAGSTTMKSFIVSPGVASASLSMGVLAPGSYNFAAEAFSVACTSVNGAGNWVADPVAITVSAGDPTNVALTFRKNAPVVVNANFVNNVKSVIAGNTTSYAVTDKDVLVAGNNFPVGEGFHPSGFPEFDSSSVPGNAVVTVAPTSNGACALRADGTVWCWGYNILGELGPDAPLNNWQPTPVQIPGISGAKMIAAGECHVCVGGVSDVKCWGRNDQGQLGDGTGVDSLTPVTVLGVSGVVASLAAGDDSTYALTRDGYLFSWGDNQFGQLGNGETTDRLSPVSVYWSVAPLSISAGASFACVLTAGGAVHCWGNNFNGQLGDGTTTSRLTPTQVVGLSAKQVVSGLTHSCALTVDDQTVCWGWNQSYQLGNRSRTQALTPTLVALDGGITLTSLSSHIGSTTCGISTTHDIYCWGFNWSGQMGDGTKVNSSFPVRAQIQ